MDGKMLARLGAVTFVAVAITATVVELIRKEERPEMEPARPAQTNAVDPLNAELFRCQSLGEAGPRDPACLRAWAENRRRFLTPGSGNTTADREQSRPRGGAPVEGSSASETRRHEATPQTEDAE